MNDSGIFMGWTRPATGQEAKAMDLYQRVFGYLTKLHAEGRISGFEPVMLGAHGSDLSGFVLIKGEREKLDAIRNSPDFRELTVRGMLALEGFRVIRAHLGGNVGQLLAAYQRVAREADPKAARPS